MVSSIFDCRLQRALKAQYNNKRIVWILQTIYLHTMKSNESITPLLWLLEQRDKRIFCTSSLSMHNNFSMLQLLPHFQFKAQTLNRMCYVFTLRVPCETNISATIASAKIIIVFVILLISFQIFNDPYKTVKKTNK